ncbi:hypothetical protein BsWGS_17676 [Bradybaena similaris]
MGCFKSKSFENIRRFSLVRSSVTYSIPEFGTGEAPGKLSAQELADVKSVVNMLRTEQLDLVVVSCMYDKLFETHHDIKQMFINAAFLDPEHTMGCSSDPWFQGFLKAFFNAIIKYILLQTDEGALVEFIADLKESHQRIKGIHRRHVELMLQSLYMELVEKLGSSIDNRKRSAMEHLLALLFHDALKFLPLSGDSAAPSAVIATSSSRWFNTVTADKT